MNIRYISYVTWVQKCISSPLQKLVRTPWLPENSQKFTHFPHGKMVQKWYEFRMIRSDSQIVLDYKDSIAQYCLNLNKFKHSNNVNIIWWNSTYNSWNKQHIFHCFFVSGDIGGQLGLFIGASFITCCEIVVYFIKKIVQLINTAK